ncbi:MAG: hypothetical protein ACOX5R_23090 [bacterium]
MIFKYLTYVMMFIFLCTYTDAESSHESRRVAYNHPDLVVDLGIGLWAIPLPMDWDGDGG